MAPRILIIDDEPDTLESLTELFKKEGYEVFSTSQSAELYTILSTPQRINLIILDLDMPVLTGVDLMKEFKDYLHRRVVPVIVYSGAYDQGKENLVFDAIEQKPYKFINKGDIEKLIKYAKEALQKSLKEQLLSEQELDELYQLENHFREAPNDLQNPKYHRFKELYFKNSGDPKTAEYHKSQRENLT